MAFRRRKGGSGKAVAEKLSEGPFSKEGRNTKERPKMLLNKIQHAWLAGGFRLCLENIST
jgi:hypothetical protein